MLMLLIEIAVVGFLVWLVQTHGPVHPAFKAAIIFIAIVWLVLLLAGEFGVAQAPRVRLFR